MMDAASKNTLRVYLSYPMSGMPGNGVPLATWVVHRLRERYADCKFTVPHEIMHGGDSHTVPGWTHEEYIQADIKFALNAGCNAIALCNGWVLSKGCTAEFQTAIACGWRVFAVHQNVLLPMDGQLTPAYQ